MAFKPFEPGSVFYYIIKFQRLVLKLNVSKSIILEYFQSAPKTPCLHETSSPLMDHLEELIWSGEKKQPLYLSEPVQTRTIQVFIYRGIYYFTEPIEGMV